MEKGGTMIELTDLINGTWNETLSEREELAVERIQTVVLENELSTPYSEYFVTLAKFLMEVRSVYDMACSGQLATLSMEELEALNHKLYDDILPERYETCYGNPEYACKIFGEKIGKQLCFLYTEFRGLIVAAYEKRRYDLLIYSELFIEIYCYFTEVNDETYHLVKSAIRYFMNDYCGYLVEYRVREMIDPSMDFATKIIMESDLSDLRYLYAFGDYVGENEIAIAKYLNERSEEEITALASTYTNGFRDGFEIMNIDLSKKSVVNIRYSIGFERIVKEAIKQFAAMGLETVVYRTACYSINKRQNLRIGYFSTSPNRQFDYDHRFDDAIYLTKSFVARKLEAQKKAYEDYKQLARGFAGPAVMEVFGESRFYPEAKKEAFSFNDHQRELTREYRRESQLIVNEYMPSDEYSFTIIAYPIPEIGECFEEIFNETIKVNTLDQTVYREIQTKLIAALDQGEFVHIQGRNANTTNIKIKLHELQNPEKETNFENCLADVNIPLGEVFTSPMLTKTNGRYHVTRVFLNGLEYVDLTLEFRDGMVVDYTCKNFETEEENKKFIKENLLYNQETLPMGELAIGTNTTAYKMGKVFGIEHLLPILIAEKTGPHIAIGDTCYHMSEENRVYNPDGKEIVAKDNECSILRKTEIEKAYFNCHTDITIPYDELKEISVIKPNGERIVLIEEGRFVLPGTEELNKPLDER